MVLRKGCILVVCNQLKVSPSHAHRRSQTLCCLLQSTDLSYGNVKQCRKRHDSLLTYIIDVCIFYFLFFFSDVETYLVSFYLQIEDKIKQNVCSEECMNATERNVGAMND